jgi:hypothetical protein
LSFLCFAVSARPTRFRHVVCFWWWDNPPFSLIHVRFIV